MPSPRLKTLITCALFCLAGVLPRFSYAAPPPVDAESIKRLFAFLNASSRQYRIQVGEKLPGMPVSSSSNEPALPGGLRNEVDAARRELAAGSFQAARQRLERAAAGRQDFLIDYLIGRALLGEGKKEAALERLKNGLLLNRNYLPLWQALSEAAGTEIRRQPIAERTVLQKIEPRVILVHFLDADRMDQKYLVWFSYAMARAVYRYEGYYRRAWPTSPWYLPSFEESLFAWQALAFSWRAAKEKNPRLTDPALDRLLKIEDRGALPGFVFIEAWDEVIREHNRNILDEYRTPIMTYLAGLFEN